MHDDEYRSFYDERRASTYAHDYKAMTAEDSSHFETLKTFIDKYNLTDKTCLEIGSSGGFFQDMVQDFYGTDIARSLSEYYHKPYRVAEGAKYPFDNEMFDAIWSFNVYEHIPVLQQALVEIERLLKPGGYLLFKAAWQCRPWAAKGYSVRPYGDFNIKGKLIKASIPVRNSVLWRSLFIFPKRMYRQILFVLGYRYKEIRYRKLKPNYEEFWISDSDACNHIDPHDMILWFKSHGFDCLSSPTNLKLLLVRNGYIVLKKE